MDQAKAIITKTYATNITPQFFFTAVHAVSKLTLANGIRDQTIAKREGMLEFILLFEGQGIAHVV